MESSIVICLAAFLILLGVLRRTRLSLGLPIAYLFSLLIIHVPGALAHLAAPEFFRNSDLIEIGMRFVALGSVCFVAGVWFSRYSCPNILITQHVDRSQFCKFCLIGGWSLVYGLSPLFRFPSIGAAVDKGGGIWMLGVMLGLQIACQRGDLKRAAMWLAALAVYPTLMLLLGGFLSYGSAAIILVCSALTVSTRSYLRVSVGILTFVFLALSIFVNYFHHRDDIRKEVWGGAPFEDRMDAVIDTVRDFEWIDLNDRQQVTDLDMRLNQNYFVGLAARRIDQGQVTYLYGESVWEGLLAVVPRILWPEKPVFAGSPRIVAKMTGLRLNPKTSFGVGNVMEFQINFGYPGVVTGFLILGYLIGKLDLNAAVAENRGDMGALILYFLPAVALIDPQCSIVEMVGGPAAALVAAYGWRRAWEWVTHRSDRKRVLAQTLALASPSRIDRP
jgi:hypothetical protein